MGLREFDEAPTLTAMLGPTNTGKTHRAVQRMLARRSGMIGLPLRLLAREVYDRVTAEVGEQKVALITGEEKRVPHKPRYWVCTVEAMPLDVPVEFLAIDEVQLCAHRERGHVFTDRLLNARGRVETWFLGSDTMRPLIEELVPTAEIKTKPRFSKLRHAGSDDLSDLPPRTAVVAFSVEQVYRVAERLRRRRGGAAVVLGALSPRARNQQVAMYQSGDVHYLVATDAIGMGLNMDIDHVAFAATRKFDGRQVRDLTASELAQVAGRAGRYRRDGTFGTLSDAGPLDSELVYAIENHLFEPVRTLQWRNHDLDFSNVEALERTLGRHPPRRFFQMTDDAEDARTLARLAEEPEVRRRAVGEDAVRLLWEVCRVPDYRKLLVDAHPQLLTRLYLSLTGPRGEVDPDWMAESLDRLDRTDGDIDSLTTRIAFVRTWTYISHQTRWFHDARPWQARTREVEDRLSDALHTLLTRRFVDHRPQAGALRRARRRAETQRLDDGLPRENTADSPFAQLLELELAPPPGRPVLLPSEARAEASAARVEAIVETTFEGFVLDAAGQILLEGSAVGRLARGSSRLTPEVEVMDPTVEGKGGRTRVYRRLLAWSRDLVDALLDPLRRPEAEGLSPDAKGLVYVLEQHLGVVSRAEVAQQGRRLTEGDRRRLARMDVRLGAHFVYVASMLKPDAVTSRAALLRAEAGNTKALPVPRRGAASVPVDPEVPTDWYAAVGYPPLGPRAVRVDQLERALAHLRQAARSGPFPPPEALLSWLGCSRTDLDGILLAAGFQRRGEQWVDPAARHRRGRRRGPRRSRSK